MDYKSTIKEAFQDILSKNKLSRTQGRRDYYGLEVETVNPEIGLIEIIFTFKRQEGYCCAEPGCHFSTKGIVRLREAMNARGIENFPPIKINAQCFIEEGAILGKYDDTSSVTGKRFFSPGYSSEAYNYNYQWLEKLEK